MVVQTFICPLMHLTKHIMKLLVTSHFHTHNIALTQESWNESTCLVHQRRDFLHKTKNIYMYNTTREKTIIILLKHFFQSYFTLMALTQKHNRLLL